MAKLFANSGDPDQMLHSAVSDLKPHSAASDLGLYCLPITLLHRYCTKTMQVFFGHVFFSITETDETIKIYKEYSKMD